MSNKMVLVKEDPLSMQQESPIREVSSLTLWSDVVSSYAPATYNVNTLAETSPFPINPTLNKKIALWEGDISQLRVDAVVHSTSETFSERSSQSDRILSKAGPELKTELLEQIQECKTGDVVVTQGYRLPSKLIFHTVGPIYSMKFKTASENALHNCYKKVLEKAYELKIKTLALCVINSVRKNYPPDEGGHTALRTIRRVLELQTANGSSLETVVLVVESADAGIYEVLLPLYFPRNIREEKAALLQLPPGKTYGIYGETVHPERQIRIIDNPHVISDTDCSVIDLSCHFDPMTDASFTHMQEDMDQQRLLGERPVPSIYPVISKEIHNQERYERLLRRAKVEDLSEVSGIGCLYQSGVDRYGRPVIVFVGKWFKFKDINLDKALLYLIYLLDPLVKGDYVIAYFHTNTSNANYPSFNWLREVYNILPYKYKKNLKAFYIVHPTFWTKMMTWWFLTFMAPAIKQKVQSLPGVEYLYSVIHPSQLEIPAFITEYDMTINGLRYFNPNSPT